MIGRMTGPRTAAVASAAAVVLIACAPALDWREVRPPGSRLRAMFPCKPASHARRVTLARSTVEMSLYACSAGDASYAIAFADMADPARVNTALDELGRMLAANLQATAPASSAPLAVAGMTPYEGTAAWRVEGRLPDGRAVQERAALFAYGTRVYQATVVASRLPDDEVLGSFFGGLRVTP
jgi:hypothetical protein